MSQISNSSYSKKGYTTITGQFESLPENRPANIRGNQVRKENIDSIKSPIIGISGLIKKAKTYLEYLKDSKRI